MSPVARLCLRLGLILAILGLWAAPVAAKTGTAGVLLGTCITPARPGMTPAALFSKSARFDCVRHQTAFGPGDYWVRSQPLAGVAKLHRRNLVRVGSLWQRSATLYALYPDGYIHAQRLDGHGATQHLQLGAIIEWTLPRFSPHGDPVQLLWHVEDSANLRGVLIGPRLMLPVEAKRASLMLAAIYAGFAGLCIALLIYNLALFAVLRHKFQLAYCGMVFSLLLYAFTSSGALAWFDPAILNNDRIRLNYLLLAIAAVAALNFARHFFEPEVSAGWVGRLVTIASATMMLAGLGYALAAPWQIRLLDTAYTLSFLPMLAAVVPIVIRARRQHSPYLWLFALAWAAPIGFAVLRLLGNMALVPWSFWIDNSTIVAMGFEAVMSSLAIAYRIRVLLVERDEARANEIAARMLADSDPLTGLMNRRAFLSAAIGRPGRQSLFIVDIDHFKRVNETLGHDGGDEVLRVFARTLRAIAPPDALVARLGGEEFAILTHADESAIEPDSVLARLRIARMPFDLTVTASIGTCTGALIDEQDWKRLYRGADRALFEAKAAGRDRVREGRITAIAA